MMAIRIQGDLSRICWSELWRLARCAAEHSSRASMHTNVHSEDVMACSIFTVAGNRGSGQTRTFFCS